MALTSLGIDGLKNVDVSRPAGTFCSSSTRGTPSAQKVKIVTYTPLELYPQAVKTVLRAQLCYQGP